MQERVNGRFSVGGRLFTRKDELQIQESLLHSKLDRGSITALENAIAYGFGDTFGVEVAIPWIFHNKLDGKKTSGLGDILVEAQWHFYPELENVALATFGIRFPTGSTSKDPGLGRGTVGWIFEIAGIHSSQCWYASTSSRIAIHQRRKQIARGILFSHTLSGGRKIYLKNNSKIYIICQLDSIYSAVSTKFGKTVPDTGGNLILLGPLISWKKKHLNIEGSFQLPIAQKVNGNQGKVRWLSAFVVELTF